jgi:GMP synthase (glutamine-hydrolysing)
LILVRVLVLQHIACEPPGVYEDVLRERGAEIVRVELDEGQALPPPNGFDAIVAMGGPMSVNDEDDHPWLRAEKQLIGEAVRDGVPFWGACLGVQLLAASLGAQVRAGPEPEVGLMKVSLTSEGREDPVFAGLPDDLQTLQWHGDTFDVPDGAVLLAGSAAYPNQAFRFRRAYGVQFHLEVSREMALAWGEVPTYAEALDTALGAGALPRLVDELDRNGPGMLEHGRLLFGNWLDATVPGA